VLTGIDAISTRADLADRSLILTLPPILEQRRRSEAGFWSAFDAACPRILGALFDALGGALGNVASTRLPALPRMADFATWVTAAEPALGWPRGAFMQAYGRNRGEVAAGTVDADPVSAAAQKLVEGRGEWQGSATELLEALGTIAGEAITRGRSWPKTAHLLSGRLDRAAPALRTAGISLERDRKKTARRIILRKLAPVGDGGIVPGDAEGGVR
jgi:hypothetical protein